MAQAEPLIVRQFPNGLKWIHRPVTHNQIFAFNLFIPGGSINESPSQAGLSRLMASTMVKGTQSRNALALAQELESLGAAFNVDTPPDALSVGGQVVAEHWEKTLDLFKDVLLHPVFPVAEVEKERESLLNDLKASRESIFSVAEERFRKEMFGSHPYGRPDGGTPESVASLTAKDLSTWYGRCVSPRGAVLVTVGHVPVKALTPWMESLAKDWIAPALGTPSIPPVVVYSTQSVTVEEPHPFEQSFVMMGYPAVPITDQNYPAVKLSNVLLGGGMSSPLFRVVREEGTLAYDVSSFYPSRRFGSAFVVYAGTDPKNLLLAEEKIKFVIQEFLRTPLSEEDLQDGKNYLRGQYLMSHQTNSRMAWYLGWWELLGKGYAYDAHYPDLLQSLTAADVHRVAQETLSLPSITVRVVPPTAQ